MWQLQVPVLELVVRTIVVYAVFLAALRLFGKRELGQFTLFDLALVLLAANALQPAITGPDASLPGAVVIIATLFVITYCLAALRRRSHLVRRILEPAATIIARDGRWLPEALSREGLDDEDLTAALREHGMERVEDVKLAALEPDGSISIVPADGPSVHLRVGHRRYRRRAHD